MIGRIGCHSCFSGKLLWNSKRLFPVAPHLRLTLTHTQLRRAEGESKIDNDEHG